MGPKYYVGISLLAACSCWGAVIQKNADEIVQQSVKNTNADWQAAPQYDFTERDIVTKGGGPQSTKTYRVMMIDGSTYNRLTAVNGRPLSPAQDAAEDRKLRQEIEKRRKESPAERQKRVAEYQKERRQDHALMSEMIKAFNFRLVGEETVNGRRCYVLDATPRPQYQPINRDTRVLKGMRGKMWVDTEQYQWVKVTAEVFRPVDFGFVFASVRPGTQFTLEQAPVQGNLWLPSHFAMRVNARVIVWSHNSTDDETYSNYHRAAATR